MISPKDDQQADIGKGPSPISVKTRCLELSCRFIRVYKELGVVLAQVTRNAYIIKEMT